MNVSLLRAVYIFVAVCLERGHLQLMSMENLSEGS